MTKKSDIKKQPETMEHEWDGIKELNYPVPSWWKMIFIGCIIYSIGYVIYYPSIPFAGKDGFFPGVAGWSQYNQLDEEIAEGKKGKEKFELKIEKLTIAQIEADSELRQFAIAGGKSQFAVTCSQCHGLGANGNKGVANLLDDEWIWGGDIANIKQTITYGIRDPKDEDTRLGVMQGFGVDEILSKKEIKDVARYVQVLAYNASSNTRSDRGKEIFEESCSACHGMDGSGNQDLGAPPLNNQVWLYGGDRRTLIETISNGRQAHMPSFNNILDEQTIKKLVVYVRSLSDIENDTDTFTQE